MDKIATKKVLNETVVKLGLVSLFADISSEMLYPITPIFLTTVLGASMTSVGLMEGVAEAVSGVLKASSGLWSDRLLKRKPFVVTGYLLSALSKPLTGLASGWTDVFWARVADRTGKGLRTAPRDALLAESVDPSLKGAAFGWHRGMDTLGAAVGPLLAFLYLSKFGHHLRPIYYLALIPGLGAVGIAALLKEKKGVKSPQNSLRFSFSYHGFSNSFTLYLLGWTLFSLANSSDIFLLLKVHHSGIGLRTMIVLYCFYNLFYALLSPYLGGLSDRLGRKTVLISGLGLFTLVYLGFSLVDSLQSYVVLFGLYGIYMAATDGVGKAFALDLIKPVQKATGLGILGAVTGLSTVVASTVAGLLWQHLGPSWTFLYGACGAVAAMGVLMKISEVDRGI